MQANGRHMAAILLATGLAACGGGDAETPAAATQRGIDRSVADIRAAEAALQQPVAVSKSVGELTAKTTSDAPSAKVTADAQGAKAKAQAQSGASPAEG